VARHGARPLADRQIDRVISFEVDDAVILERITGRRSDPDTGRVYHVRFDPPPADIAPRLVQRPTTQKRCSAAAWLSTGTRPADRAVL